MSDEEFVKQSLAAIMKLKQKLARFSEPIAIIGMSCRYPGGGNSPEEFWKMLESGVDGIREVPKDRFNVDDFYDPKYDVPGKMYTRSGGFLNIPVDVFDADFFGISPKEANEMDPQQRLLLEVTWEALEDALIPPETLTGTSTGFYAGMMYYDYSQLIIESSGPMGMGAYYGSGNAFAAAAGRVSFVLGLQGPCLSIDTACSSSLVSINSAIESLHLGQCDLAIAGGVSLMLAPGSFIGACQAHMLSPDGHCKTFDKSADGYARAEGCGIIVLKKLSDAIQSGDKIYAVIRSSGVNHGGATSGLTVPSGDAQEKLIRSVYSQAGLKPDDIDYVEAHGTGTSLGDPIEVRAIGATYGQRSKPLLIGSVKSNIGHTESAAGAAGVIKAVLSLNHQMLPANLNFKELNPYIELNFPAKIVVENTPWKKGEHIRRAGVSSFGFSGINAHVIIEEAPKIEPKISQVEERPFHILTLSAKKQEDLERVIQSYQTFLEKTNSSLPDICYSANIGRNHEKYRIAVIAKDMEELKSKLARKDFNTTNELANSYVKGANIDWEAFDAPYARKKVTLPSYPFLRKRYWSESAKVSTSQVSTQDWMYEWVWKELPLGEITAPQGEWLIFGKGDLIGNFQIVSTVPTKKDEFITLISQKPFKGIIYIAESNDCTKDFLHLTQALATLQDSHKVPLYFITSTDLVHSTIPAMQKSILAEYPSLKINLIVTDNRNLIYQGIFSKGTEPYMNVKDNKFFVPRLQHMQDSKKSDLKIRSDGNYLITGGLGGLGLTLAKWLLEKGAGNIVLTGRRELKDELKDLGPSVTYVKLDISNEQEVAKLLNEKSFKGIFHLAGVLDDATLLEQNWTRFEKVFGPKVHGSFYLHKYSKDLDLFVLFSSSAASLGSPGQSNYAAANGFMDALALFRTQQGLPAHSLAWGTWSEVGMAKSLATQHAKGGMLAINPKDGMIAMEDALRTDKGHLLIMNINWDEFLKQKVHIPPWFENFSSKQKEKISLTEQLKAIPPNEGLRILHTYVTDKVKSALGIPESDIIEPNKSLFDMGLDSLMSIDLKNKLQSELSEGTTIPATFLLENPNIDKIVEYLSLKLNIGEVVKIAPKEDLKAAETKKIQDEISSLSADEAKKLMMEKLRKRKGL